MVEFGPTPIWVCVVFCDQKVWALRPNQLWGWLEEAPGWGSGRVPEGFSGCHLGLLGNIVVFDLKGHQKEQNNWWGPHILLRIVIILSEWHTYTSAFVRKKSSQLWLKSIPCLFCSFCFSMFLFFSPHATNRWNCQTAFLCASF